MSGRSDLNPKYLRCPLQGIETWIDDLTFQSRPTSIFEGKKRKNLQEESYGWFDRYGGFLSGGKNDMEVR